MIDKRGNGLTEDQINELKDITRRVVALEAIIYTAEYEDKKWFHIWGQNNYQRLTYAELKKLWLFLNWF